MEVKSRIRRIEKEISGLQRDRIRVVIAEDDGMTMLFLRRAFSEAGFEVVKAVRDGQQAIEAIREHLPDALVMDIEMPRLGGIEAARRIRSERPMPIILMTGHYDPSLIAAALASGAHCCLIKPVVAAQVIDAVRAALATPIER
jgi:CheY-like chemotaxis protein